MTPRALWTFGMLLLCWGGGGWGTPFWSTGGWGGVGSSLWIWVGFDWNWGAAPMVGPAPIVGLGLEGCPPGLG